METSEQITPAHLLMKADKLIPMAAKVVLLLYFNLIIFEWVYYLG